MQLPELQLTKACVKQCAVRHSQHFVDPYPYRLPSESELDAVCFVAS